MDPEPFQMSKMECFAEIVNGIYPLTVFAKRSILHVLQGLPQGLHSYLQFSKLAFFHHSLFYHWENTVEAKDSLTYLKLLKRTKALIPTKYWLPQFNHQSSYTCYFNKDW